MLIQHCLDIDVFLYYPLFKYSLYIPWFVFTGPTVGNLGRY